MHYVVVDLTNKITIHVSEEHKKSEEDLLIYIRDILHLNYTLLVLNDKSEVRKVILQDGTSFTNNQMQKGGE